MRGSRPSFTARRVALVRAGLDRPHMPTGDATAEARLYGTLAPSRWAPIGSATRQGIQSRTAFFDRENLVAVASGIRQVVVVGAGYDGRSIRFAFPGVTYFEVDHPATQRDKQARLATIGYHTRDTIYIPVDLTGCDLDEELRRGGHAGDRPTLFVLEGLLSYLTREVTASLLEALRERAAPGSRLAVGFLIDSPDRKLAQRAGDAARRAALRALGEPWVTVFARDEPDRLLARAGWSVATDGDGVAIRYEGKRGVLVSAGPALR